MAKKKSKPRKSAPVMAMGKKRIRFAPTALRVEGKAAGKIRAALKKRGSAAELRRRIIDALGDAVAPDVWPAWLAVESQVLDTAIHLESPIFTTTAADDDEFYCHTRKKVLLYHGKGKATWFSADESESKTFKLKPRELKKVDCHNASGIVLTEITWYELPPDNSREFDALLKKAADAACSQMEAYDIKDYVLETAGGTKSQKQAELPAAVPGSGGMFQINHARDAHIPEDGPAKKPKLVWRTAGYIGGDESGGSAVVADGMIFGAKGSYNAYFDALDLNGKRIWQRKMSEGQSWPTCQPCIDRGVLYLGTNHGLYALDAKTGRDRWLARLSSISGSPLVVDSLCFVGAGKGMMALDINSGRKKWAHSLKMQAGTPSYADGVLYFLGEGKLWALEAATGKVVWKTAAKVDEYPHCGPTIVDDLVVFADSKLGLSAAARSSGRTRWSCDFTVKKFQELADRPFAAAEGLVLAFDRNGALHAIDARSGKRRWVDDRRGKAYGIGKGGVTIAGTRVYATMVEDRKNSSPVTYVCALDLHRGKLLWQIQELDTTQLNPEDASWYCTPIVHAGVLYVQSGLEIYAFK